MRSTSLSQAILDLESGKMSRLEDRDLAFALAQHSKPYVDKLFELKNELNGKDAGDANLSMGILAAESDLTKNEDQTAPVAKQIRMSHCQTSSSGPLPELLSISHGERARWLFMDRFISLEKYESTIGYNFEEKDVARFQQELNSLVEHLLLLPGTIEAAEKNDIPALQKIFATSVLVFRNPVIGGVNGTPIPCCVANIREMFPHYFYKHCQKPNWFEDQEFYLEPIARPHWVLCETEGINCTLRKPESKLRNFAKTWGFEIENVRQKSVVEDVLDRVICGEALEENIFSGNCNSLTSTTYGGNRNNQGRLVYTVQRARKITIHGKAGIPHWSTKRRLWPGIYPTLSLT